MSKILEAKTLIEWLCTTKAFIQNPFPIHYETAKIAFGKIKDLWHMLGSEMFNAKVMILAAVIKKCIIDLEKNLKDKSEINGKAFFDLLINQIELLAFSQHKIDKNEKDLFFYKINLKFSQALVLIIFFICANF